MPAGMTTVNKPNRLQFAIGNQIGSTATAIGTAERVNAPLVDVIYGLLENRGKSNFTFSLVMGRVATGSLSLAGQPGDTETVVLNDGVNPAVTFEFDSNNSVTQSNTLRQVVIGASLAQTAANLIGAINKAPLLNITASIATYGLAATVLYLFNDGPGTAGNVAITDTSANVTFTGMSGGTGAAKNIRVNGSSVASVVVVPGARVEFTIEFNTADTVQDFMNFFAVPAVATQAFGSLTLNYNFGELIRYEKFAGVTA